MKIDTRYDLLNIRMDWNERQLASLGSTLQVVTFLAEELAMIRIVPISDPYEMLKLLPCPESETSWRRHERMLSFVVQRSLAGDLFVTIANDVLSRNTSSCLSIHNSGIRPLPGETTTQATLERGLPTYGVQVILQAYDATT